MRRPTRDGSGHRYLFRAFERIAAGPVTGPGTQLVWSIRIKDCDTERVMRQQGKDRRLSVERKGGTLILSTHSEVVCGWGRTQLRGGFRTQ